MHFYTFAHDAAAAAAALAARKPIEPVQLK